MKFTVLFGLIVGLFIATALFAQSGQTPLDLNGSWSPVRGATPGGRRNVDFPPANQLPLQPATRAKYDASRPLTDLETGCTPRGAVRQTLTSMLPMDILQTPQKTIFLFNQHSAFRRE